VDVDYLRVHATVNGVDTIVDNDDYGTGPGQQPNAWGDWTPRANMSDPSLEVPGVVADAWSPTYFTTDPGTHLAYSTQVWNGNPGKLPRGTTKVWVEVNVRIDGSGVLCLGWDWYGSNGYIGNAGYSGMQTYLAAGAQPSWQVVTLGK